MPQDNLTISFQKELEKRGIQSSLSLIEDILEQEGLDPQATQVTAPTPESRGESLWGALETGQLPDWWEGDTGDWGYDATWGALLGKSLWSFTETAAIGIPGFVARTIDEQLFPGGRKWEEIVAPKTTAERWSTAITGVAGFIPPFTAARGVATAALKGARVTQGIKGGRVVGYGAEAASKKYVDNTVRILKSDKEFLKWAGSRGMGPDDIEKFIRESDFVSHGVQAITKTGTRKGARIFGNHSIRTQYAKDIEQNIPKIVNSKIDEIAAIMKPTAKAIKEGAQPLVIQDKARRLIADEVTKYVGGKYNFPVTNMHQYLSLKWGNTKLASLGASAAEEAILFTAVEIPMNFFMSLNNEDIDFDLFSTIGHSVALGSALGLVRLIPGGSDAGILRTGFKRMNQYLSRRKRWSSYNVNSPEERMLLVRQAEHIWEANDDIFSTLTRSDAKGLRKLLRDRKDISSFISGSEAEARAGATELKKWMTSLEGAFMREWWPGFVKNAGKDIWGSSGRMIAGSMAFNVGTLIAYQKDELPFEDLVFHTLLGAVLSKKGRDIEYRNENGDMVLIPGSRRPMYHETKFEKVNQYLDMLGMNVDHAAFRNLMNNMEVVKKYGTPDLSHSDIKLLRKVAEDSKLIVAADKDPVLKNESTQSNPLYESIKMILESTIKDPEVQRVKTIEELSNKELLKLTAKLRETEFKSLAEYRTNKSASKGITSPFDVFDILLSASKPATKETLKIYEGAVEQAYNTIYEMDHVANGGRAEEAPMVQRDANGKMLLRPLTFDTSSVVENASRMGGLFGRNGEDKNSALGILSNRAVISGEPVMFTGDMSRKLFGSRETGQRGDIDQYDRDYHKTIFGELPVDDHNLITIGEKVFNDKLRRSMFNDAIVTTWKELSYIRDIDSQSSLFGEETRAVKELMMKIYGDKPYLPSGLAVIDAGGKRVGSESAEQKFATNLLSVLSSDVKQNVNRKDLERQIGVDPEVATAYQSDVAKLMNHLDKGGLLDGFRGEDADVETFVKRLTDYTFEKSLGNATRNDGTPLREEDFALLQVLQESRIAGKNFEMARMSNYIGDIKTALKRADIISRADSKAIDKDVAYWVRSNFDKVDKVFDELSKSTDPKDKGLYEVFEELSQLSRSEGTDSETLARTVDDYVSLYEKSLKPLWSNGRGDGILKESDFQAKPTQWFMHKLITQIDAIKTGAITGSYNRLLNSIYDIHTNTKSAAYKDFMTTVHNALYDRKANTTKVLEVLKRFNLYSDETGSWLVDPKDKSFSDIIKKASEDVYLLTQPVTTERSIELMQQRDKLDFLPKHDSDLTVSMTFDKLTKDWGILIDDIGDVKPQDFVMEDVYTQHGNFSLDNFFDYMMSKMVVREIGGVKYDKSNWKDMPQDSQKKLVSDMHKVWVGLTQTREVSQLKIAQDAIPIARPETVRRNHVTDVLEDLFGEIVFTDLDYRLADGKVYNVTNVSGNVLADYLADVSRVGQKLESRKAIEEEPLPHDSVQRSGYLTAFVGDLDYGIGIPIHPYVEGSLTGQNKLANRFVERLNSVEERFVDKEIRRAAKSLRKKYVENEDTSIVEKVELEDGTSQYIFKRPTAQDIRASDEASLMLSVVIGDTKFGELFWKAAVNSKRDTKKWAPEKELAHDFFRRIRLMANGSTLKLETKAVKSVVDFYNRHFDEGELGADFDVLKNVLEPITKSGMVTAHIVKDEGDITNPKATSAFRGLAEQIKAERDANPNVDIKNAPELKDGKLVYPGGVGDTSHVNSVIIVPENFMKAMRMMTGDYWRTNAIANKPIISYANDRNAAFIGKTMFVVDSNFEPYFEANDINMLIFQSSAKGMASDYKGSVVDLEKQGITSIENLIYSDVAKKEARVMDKATHEIGLPIDSIGIQMWQAEDKPARIPMHVGADLVGRATNNEYFDWLMGKAVSEYQDKVGVVASGTQVNRQIAFAKVLFGDVGSDLDNQMYSTIGRMLEFNMYPMFLPWRRTMKNAMMRHFVQEEGVFSPQNQFGSQSAAIPSYYAHDHPLGLRNPTFHGENYEIYTYGQGEIGINNRSKGIGNNLSLTVHHKSKADELMSWGDFIKDRRKLITDQLRKKKLSGDEKALLNTFKGNLEGFMFDGRRANTQGEVHDFLVKLNKAIPGEGVAEIALVWHRTPSLKSSDKVIVGLKGYVQEGNLARLNTIDFWTRLEGDHDFDKVNYWWDTPTGVLNEWKNNAGNIMSVADTSIPTTIEGLSLDNPASIREYNFNSARATKMRGPVVKSRRVVQWMKHYQGKDTEVSGYNMVVGPRGEYRISINQDKANQLDELIATDSQRIIDSKDGWKREDFTDDYYKHLLFGNDTWVQKDGSTWGGIFEVSKKDSRTQKWNPSDNIVDEIWKDAIIESIKPYQGFLQLATDVYSGGEAKKVDYVTLIEGFEGYRDGLNRLNRLVLKGLRRKYKDPAKLKELFGNDLKKPRDIFGLNDAIFPRPANRTKLNTAGDAINLLPFDRGVWALASVDRMFTEKPRKSNRLDEDTFDEIWREYIDEADMTDKVIKKSVETIRKESKSIAIINSLGSKISRTRSAIDRMNKKQKWYPDSSNEELIIMFKDRLSRLEKVKSGIESRILSDENTSKAIRDTIRSQIVVSLSKGWPVKLRKYSKSPDGKRMVLGSTETINLKGLSPSKRKKWIKKNAVRINKNIYNNNQLVPRVRGMDSNEYAQLVMWHQTMVDFYGFSLDPREFDFAQQFEIDISESRRFVSDSWRKFKTGKDYMPNEREDVVNADLMRMMDQKFMDWESRQSGLGLLWVFKFMTPEPDMTIASYHQGKWMPGFKNIDKETKYINLGMNFLNSTNRIPQDPMLKLYSRKASFPAKEFAQQADRRSQIFKQVSEVFTDKMRVLYNEVPIRDPGRMTAEELHRMGGTENRKDMFDFKIGSEDASRDFNTRMDEVFKQIDKGDLDDIANLSPEIKRYYGITGTDIAVDYLSMRGAPIGYDRLYDIRQLADFLFRPSKVLNSRGKLRTIKDLKSFYGFTKRNAQLFFGQASQRDMLTGKDTPHMDINPYGSRLSPIGETRESLQQIWTDKTTSVYCG